MELALVGGGDGVEACSIVGAARQHDLDTLRRLTHHPSVRRVAPLPDRVADRKSVGEARRDLAGNETPPGSLAYTHTIADIAAEQELGNLSGPLCAVADKRLRLRGRITDGSSQQN